MLLVCRECGKQISHAAGKCPYCGCKKPFKGVQVLNKEVKSWDRSEIKDFIKSGGAIKSNIKPIKWFFSFFGIFFILILIIGLFEESKLTPEQKAARDEARAIERERKKEEKTKNTTTAMSAEFYTMSECLEGIKRSSGFDLEVITDRPNEVSGFLSNGEGFGCKKKSTGTKGIYYEGWFLKR